MIYKKFTLFLTTALLISVLAGCYRQKNIKIDKQSSSCRIFQSTSFLSPESPKDSGYYSFANCSPQDQIRLIDLYYQKKELLLAKNIADNFIHAYPFYAEIDHILYTRALINMELEHQGSSIYGLITLNNPSHDPSYLNNAISDFSKLIKRYPSSRYAASAEENIVELENKLAYRDLSIVSFYFRKGSYNSVISRANNIIKKYPGTLFSHKAAFLKEEAYQKMGDGVVNP